MISRREISFDILRVISMVQVIIIHVSNVYSRSFGFISNSSYLISLIFNTISRISVPIFLMISGALLVDKDFNFKKYTNRLIKYFILIIVWDIIYLLWEYFYLGITYNKLYRLFLEPYRAHLWFLYTIIVLYAIQPLIKIVLNKSNNTIKTILFIIWISLSTLSLRNSLIASVFTIFSYMGFFILGKYIYEFAKNNDLKKYNVLLVISMIISYIISICLNYYFSIKYNLFYNVFFAYRTPFIIIASFSFFMLIITYFKNKTIPKWIEFLSSVSLGVYLIHGIFLDISIKIFSYSNVNSLIGIPLFTIFIFILSIISTSIIKKCKYIKMIIE